MAADRICVAHIWPALHSDPIPGPLHLDTQPMLPKSAGPDLSFAWGRCFGFLSVLTAFVSTPTSLVAGVTSFCLCTSYIPSAPTAPLACGVFLSRLPILSLHWPAYSLPLVGQEEPRLQSFATAHLGFSLEWESTACPSLFVSPHADPLISGVGSMVSNLCAGRES